MFELVTIIIKSLTIRVLQSESYDYGDTIRNQQRSKYNDWGTRSVKKTNTPPTPRHINYICQCSFGHCSTGWLYPLINLNFLRNLNPQSS